MSNNTSMKLLHRPLARSYEGMNGYLVRLAEANGLSGIAGLWPRREFSFEKICNRLGIDNADASISHIRHFIRQFTNENTHRPVWHRRYRRFCPTCLTQEEIWRQEWELTMVTACVNHGSQLIDRCGQCGTRQNWANGSLVRCDCGAHLSRTIPMQAEQYELLIAKLLTQKLYEEKVNLKPLRLLSLEQTNKFLFMLGAYALNNGRRFSQKISNLMDIDVVRPLVISAGSTLHRWPIGFFQFLRKLRNQKEIDLKSAALSKRFGYFYKYLYTQLKEPEFAFLHQTFERYIEKHWSGSLAARNKRLSEELKQRHMWVPINIVAKDIKTTRKRLKQLIDEGAIKASSMKTAKGRTVICIERKEIRKAQSILENMVDLQTAAAMLGLKKKRVLQLISGRKIGVIFKPKKSHTAQWGIPKQNLEALLAIGRALPIMEQIDSSESVSMQYALQYWIKVESAFPDLIMAIVEGALTPIAQSVSITGVAGWIFDYSELREWITGYKISGRDGGFSIPEAAKQLAIKQEAMYFLVNNGLIKNVIGEVTIQRVIKEEELKAFSEKFVLGREIKMRTGILPSHAARMLEKQLIFPVSGAAIDGGRMNIYKRDHVLDNALLNLEK